MFKYLHHVFKSYSFSQISTYSLHELKRLFRRIFQNSYSLDGEDLIIHSLLDRKKYGFYVDVGACDPVRLSNTKRFYDIGWRGVNIDANPNSLEVFRRSRPRDINLNFGIGLNTGHMDFYELFPKTLGTFSVESRDRNLSLGHKLVSTQKVSVKTLGAILDSIEDKEVKNIDFLSVDVEGYDFEALSSNNWDKYSPTVVCIESPTQFVGVSKNSSNQIVKFLDEKGYDLAYCNGIDLFFKKRK